MIDFIKKIKENIFKLPIFLQDGSNFYFDSISNEYFSNDIFKYKQLYSW